MACPKVFIQEPFPSNVPVIQNYETCLGINADKSFINDGTWLNAWTLGNCNFLFDNQPYIYQNDIMYYLLSRYYSRYPFALDTYGAPPAEQAMLQICTNYPGSCSKIQKQQCSSCTRDHVASKYGLVRFCGCFLNVPDPSCDSLCVNYASIKNANAVGETIECNEAVCVMNNISIKASNSTFNNATIGQVCSNCLLSNGCKCLIDVSVPSIVDILGINSNNGTFETYCNSSECYYINPDQSTTKVDCNLYNVNKSQNVISKVPHVVWWITVLFLFLGILLIISLYEWSTSRLNNNK